MTPQLSDSRLANLGANTILEGFEFFQTQFNAITRRAKKRFETRDWAGMQEDATERLDSQDKMVYQIVEELKDLLGDRCKNKLIWASIKAVYSGLIAHRDNWELAETFYNSVTRRIFTTSSGVDPQVEFVDTDFEVPPTKTKTLVYRTYNRSDSISALIRTIILDYQFQIPFKHLDQDIHHVTDRLKTHLREIGALQVVEWAEVIKAAFFRRKAAYLVGRLYSGSHVVPIVIALRNYKDGIVIDALLLNEDDASILFSFARSYFHIDVDRPYDLVRFLRSIMPRKRIAELYISLGYNKHGKTELYRDILHHFAYTNNKFEIARGQRGMVMVTFTMPDYDIIIKIIKDHFDPPKKTNHQAVKDKYYLVFMHDRAGRLIDAQKFERLRFDRQYFSKDLLEELQAVAASAVEVTEDAVTISLAYIERRVIPLNIYVNEADEEAARAAVIDYGNAIKDLAATNIFPGDLLLKNFGVSRHGRVLFYDYDEISLLTDCKFRRMPPARSYVDEFSDEPWFAYDEDDIFPEQFPQFLGLRDDLRDVFVEHHSDLFDANYWKKIQEQLNNANIPLIYPYSNEKRLYPDNGY